MELLKNVYTYVIFFCLFLYAPCFAMQQPASSVSEELHELLVAPMDKADKIIVRPHLLRSSSADSVIPDAYCAEDSRDIVQILQRVGCGELVVAKHFFNSLYLFLKYRFSDGQTILHRLVARAKGEQDISLIKKILQRRDSLLLAVDDKGQSCLWNCYEPEVLECVLQYLREKKTFLIRKTKKHMHYTDLLNACNDNGINVLQFFIAKQKVFSEAFDEDSVKKRNAYLRIIRLLVQYGASFRDTNRIGYSAMDFAYRIRNNEVIFFFKTVDLMRLCGYKTCTVKKAIDFVNGIFDKDIEQEQGYKQYMLDMLYALPDPQEPFIFAMIKKAYFFDNFIDIPYRDYIQQCILFALTPIDLMPPENYSLMHIAVLHHDIDMVQFLLDWGISPNVVDFLGNTPLHIALVHGHKEIAKKLIPKTDMYRSNTLGSTALDFLLQQHSDLLPFYCNINPVAIE